VNGRSFELPSTSGITLNIPLILALLVVVTNSNRLVYLVVQEAPNYIVQKVLVLEHLHRCGKPNAKTQKR
jgi:hypothetical protein